MNISEVYSIGCRFLPVSAAGPRFSAVTLVPRL